MIHLSDFLFLFFMTKQQIIAFHTEKSRLEAQKLEACSICLGRNAEHGTFH